jgi:hypothetical protein
MSNIEQFDINLESNSCTRAKWNNWVEQLEFYLITKDLDAVLTTEKTFAARDKKRCAFLSHLMGPKTYARYKTVKATEDTFSDIVTKIGEIIEPVKNIFYERSKYEQIHQHEGESITNFIERLREAVALCDFKADHDN